MSCPRRRRALETKEKPPLSIAFRRSRSFSPTWSDSLHRCTLPPAKWCNCSTKCFQLLICWPRSTGWRRSRLLAMLTWRVSGLPSPREDHARAAADLALDMLGEIEQFNRGLPHVIAHSHRNEHGPVIADHWPEQVHLRPVGDTVNTASRMESHGFPGLHSSHGGNLRTAARRALFKPRYRSRSRAKAK